MSNFLKIVIALVVLIVIYTFVKSVVAPYFSEYEVYEIEEVEHQDFIISTGQISAVQDVSIKFEEDARVSRILKTAGDEVFKGDVLIETVSDELLVEHSRQKSILEREVATLKGIVEGLSETQIEKVAAETQAKEQVVINNTRLSLANIQKLFFDIEGIVFNSIDPYFDNPQKDPSVQIKASSTTKVKINQAREEIEEILQDWRDQDDEETEITPETTVEKLKVFISTLYQIEQSSLDLYDELRALANRSTTSEENQEFFDNISLARSSIADNVIFVVSLLNTLEDSIIAYERALLYQQEVLEGSLLTERQAQLARVNTERENLKKIELRLNKTKIVSPFDGVVGEILVEEKEQVAAGGTAARVVSVDGYKIEINITEIDVQSIKVGQETRAYVDALDEYIDVVVRTIGGAERILSGVPVYNIVFDLLEDRNYLSGFSVDVYIPVGDKKVVNALPREAIQTQKNNQKYILAEIDGKTREVRVIEGIRISNTLVEVQSKEVDLDTVDKVLLIKQDK